MSALPILDPGQVATVLNEPELVLPDFWQAACAPCRALEPRLDQFAQHHPGEFRGYRSMSTPTSTPPLGSVCSPSPPWCGCGRDIKSPGWTA